MSESYSPPGGAVAAKSKLVAALLAFFFGSIGVHSFYLGQKQKGLIHLALFVLGGILWMTGAAQMLGSLMSPGSMPSLSPVMIFGVLLVVANGIWALTEFIQILIKSDADFASTYN